MIGIDILSVKRFKKVFNENFRDRIFSERERKYCESKRNKILNYAVRFAAKEAVIKAIKKKKINLKDIEILNKKDGSPFVLIKKKRIKLEVSLSHENDFVVAVALKK